MSWRRGKTSPPHIPYKTPADTIEYIYFELNHRGNHPISWLEDCPFPAWSRWPASLRNRYLSTERLMGREALVICMHSVQFRVSLESYTAQDWKKLLRLLAPLHGSLRMFALSRNIPYHESYSTSTLAAAIGPLPAPSSVPSAPHPHDLYLCIDGHTIKRSYFTTTGGTQHPTQTIKSNIYHPPNFTYYPRPDSWPPKWPYPHPPNDPIRDPASTEYPRCMYCRLETKPMGSPPRCTCRTRTVFWRPVVEIVQFPDYIEGVLNRGVRILQPIPKGAILDEYVGEYIPLPSTEVMHDFGDQVYAFACYGPPICWEGDESGDVEDICGLIGGQRGNWTRFINHMDAEEANCQYESRVFAGKLRILVVAKRDLRMGEELFVDYGPNYFTQE